MELSLWKSDQIGWTSAIKALNLNGEESSPSKQNEKRDGKQDWLCKCLTGVDFLDNGLPGGWGGDVSDLTAGTE